MCVGVITGVSNTFEHSNTAAIRNMYMYTNMYMQSCTHVHTGIYIYIVCVYIHVQCTSNKIGGNYGTIQEKLHVGVCSCLKRGTLSCLLACSTQHVTEDYGCIVGCGHGTHTVCGDGMSMTGGHGILHRRTAFE